MYDTNNSISALSYNVWGLPIRLPGHDQTTRFQKLADSLSSRNFNIICLQEVFHKNIRKELSNKLLPDYFHASDYECNQNIVGKWIQKDCYGGLMTLSKFPILQENFYRFKNLEKASIIERIGGKGFLFTTILWNGEPVNIINTHLYAGGGHQAVACRKNQILQMEEILQSIESYQRYPTLLFGDLNVIHSTVATSIPPEVYRYITTEMSFCDNKEVLDENSYTINPTLNSYTSPNEQKQKLDYIMIHNPEFSSTSIRIEEEGYDFYGCSALSDHLGWKAQLIYQGIRQNDNLLVLNKGTIFPN